MPAQLQLQLDSLNESKANMSAQLQLQLDSLNESKANQKIINDLVNSLENTYDHEMGTIKYGIKTITPKIAASLLGSNVANNRNIGNANLNKIESAMFNDDFLSLNGQAIILGRNAETGDIELLDAQHRMQAIVNTNSSYPLLITMLEQVTGDTFLTMDSGKKRTLRDHFKITGRNPRLATTLLVGYGYQTQKNRMVGYVDLNSVAAADIYDKNRGLEKSFIKTSKVVSSSKISTAANKLCIDQSIYMVLYLIEKNFGVVGKQFVDSLLCMDDSKLQDAVDVRLHKNQISCIKYLHKLFNGLDRGFDQLVSKNTSGELSLFKSDTRVKRSCKSLLLAKAFVDFFVHSKSGFREAFVKNAVQRYDYFTHWPELGKFNI